MATLRDRADRCDSPRPRTPLLPAALALLLAGLVALIAPSAVSGSAAAPDRKAGVQEVWDGVWETTKIHGTIRLKQDGRDVRGRYLDGEGDRIPGAKIIGEVKGRDGTKLVGEYDCDGHGTFSIELTSGETFAGEYDPDGFFKRAKNWRGRR